MHQREVFLFNDLLVVRFTLSFFFYHVADKRSVFPKVPVKKKSLYYFYCVLGDKNLPEEENLSDL